MTSTRTVELEFDGLALEVEVTIESWGYPSNGWDDAGEGPEFGIAAVLDGFGKEVDLSDDQRARLETFLVEEGHLDPPDYDDFDG